MTKLPKRTKSQKIGAAVRKVFGLKKRDKICYTIQSDGQVVISRAEQME